MALPTEAWRGAEIRKCSAENGYVDLPGPTIFQCFIHFIEEEKDKSPKWSVDKVVQFNFKRH